MKFIDGIRRAAERYPRLAEIVRFLFAGGIATVCDMLTMGVVLYLFDASLYPRFYNVWIGGGDPSVAAAVVGTGAGFIVGLIVNYVFSVLFVFRHKDRGRSVRGFLVFAALSLVGLGLHLGGMYLGYDVLGINEWLVKIVMTVIVLVYNYVSKRLLLFRATGSAEETAATADRPAAAADAADRPAVADKPAAERPQTAAIEENRGKCA